MSSVEYVLVILLGNHLFYVLFIIYDVYFIIIYCTILLCSVVVFTVQNEAYQLEEIHKEKEGTHTLRLTINCKCVIDYNPLCMQI